MESQFERLVFDGQDLINTALNTDGNELYYSFRDNFSPYFDEDSGLNYTLYEFYQVWDSVSHLLSWLANYGAIVFDTDIVNILLDSHQLYSDIMMFNYV